MSNAPSSVLGEFSIFIDGKAMAAQDLSAVVRLEVERGTKMADRCEIVLADPRWEWSTTNRPAFGAKIEVKIPYQGNDIVIFEGGKVARMDISQERGGGSHFHIVAFGPRYSLGKGNRAAAFVDSQVGVTLSDVAKAGGVKGEAGDTPNRSYLLQANQANLSVIEEFAARSGLIMRAEGENIDLAAPSLDNSGVKLTYGTDLIQFRVEVNSLNPLAKIKGTAHDYKQKGVWKHEVSAHKGQATGWDEAGTDIVGKKFGKIAHELADLPVKSQGELERIVQAVYDDRAFQFIVGEGVALGIPTIPVAKVVEIEKLGKRLSGAYYITRVVHRLSRKDGYSVYFEGCRPAWANA